MLSRFERAIELQMDILNYIKPFIKGNCWDLDYHIELAKLSIYTGTNYASFTVFKICKKAIELQMDITNYIKPFIMGSCWVLDHHIELAKLSINTGTNYASFTV